MTGAVEIGLTQLILATGFIVIAAGLSLALSLGYCRSLIIATVRTYLQLFALGFVLRWVFAIESAWLVLAILTVMLIMAVFTIQGRVTSGPKGIFPSLLGAVFLSGVTVTFAVTALIVNVEPWYAPRYVIPIGGMVIGNSMTGLALALERLFGDMRKRREEINTLLSLGATTLGSVIAVLTSYSRAFDRQSRFTLDAAR